MAKQSNPPIKGHALIREGSCTLVSGWSTRYWVGGCSCGAKPEGFPSLSANAMKRWHREHKAQLREQQS